MGFRLYIPCAITNIVVVNQIFSSLLVFPCAVHLYCPPTPGWPTGWQTVRVQIVCVCNNTFC